MKQAAFALGACLSRAHASGSGLASFERTVQRLRGNPPPDAAVLRDPVPKVLKDEEGRRLAGTYATPDYENSTICPNATGKTKGSYSNPGHAAIIPSHANTTNTAMNIFETVDADHGITIDGNIDDWTDIMGKHSGIPMYQAGNYFTKPHTADAWVHYDCEERVLCVLVKTKYEDDPYYYLDSTGPDGDSNTWIKTGGGSAINDGVRTIPHPTIGGVNIGWEGCFDDFASTCYNNIEIHANYKIDQDGTSETTSTGKSTGSGEIALDLHCRCSNDSDCNDFDGDNSTDTCKDNFICEQKFGLSDPAVNVCTFMESTKNGNGNDCCLDDDDCKNTTGVCASAMCVQPPPSPDTPASTPAPTTTPTPAPQPAGGGTGGVSAEPTSSPTSSPTKAECYVDSDCKTKVVSDDCNKPFCNLGGDGSADNSCTTKPVEDTVNDDGKLVGTNCNFDGDFSNECGVPMCFKRDGDERSSCMVFPKPDRENESCTTPSSVTSMEALNSNTCYKGANGTDFVVRSLNEDEYANQCVNAKCVPQFFTGADGLCAANDSPCRNHKCAAPTGGDTNPIPNLQVCTEQVMGHTENCNSGMFGDELYNSEDWTNPDHADYKGPCYAKDKCGKDGKEGQCQVDQVTSFHGWDVECRGSVGHCDAPETCALSKKRFEDNPEAGADYSCVEDFKLGDDEVTWPNGTKVQHVCRKACSLEGCSADVEEVCPGGQDFCPINVVMKANYDVYAGKNHKAGDADVTATRYSIADNERLGNGMGTDWHEICVNFTLAEGWSKAGENEACLAYVGKDTPGSNPGSYNVRDIESQGFTATGEEWYNICAEPQTVSEDFFKSDGWSFALHCNVVNDSGDQETSWAVSNDCQNFYKTSGKKQVQIGWGNHCTMQNLCDADGNDADDTVACYHLEEIPDLSPGEDEDSGSDGGSGSGGGDTGAPAPTSAPTSSPTPSPTSCPEDWLQCVDPTPA